MKASSVSLLVIAMAGLMIACKGSDKLALTGELKLGLIGRTSDELRFRLKNGTATSVSFWGVRDWWWEDVSPQGSTFECVLTDSGEMLESPFLLIDGPHWREFVIEPRQEIDMRVSTFNLKDGDARFPTGRCRLLLQIEGGVVKSEEFEVTPNVSS